MAEFKFPSEEVDLPSKGLIYPEGHPLSKGKIEIKYMTAKEEDILTNQSYIQKGTVLGSKVGFAPNGVALYSFYVSFGLFAFLEIYVCDDGWNDVST